MGLGAVDGADGPAQRRQPTVIERTDEVWRRGGFEL
jgi:hypothetical protein